MTNALVVIDVQESFRVRPLWQAVSNPAVVARVGTLVDAARAAGDLVVWVLHAEPGSGGEFDPARGHVRVMTGLDPAAGEPIITKTSHNAFTTTNLQQVLTERGIRELTVCGLRTEQCVETTARSAPTSATRSPSSRTPPRPSRSRTGTPRPARPSPSCWPTRVRWPPRMW